MKTIKIIPKSQKAENCVSQHGENMELLQDKDDSFCVRSLGDTFSYTTDLGKGKWVGWFTKEEADYEI